MGIFRQGLKSFIKLVLPILLLVNLYVGLLEIYGADFNVLGVPLENFQTGFFGFRSFLLMIRDYPSNVFTQFFNSLQDLLDITFFGIPRWVNEGGFNAPETFNIQALFKIIFQPIYFIIYAVINLGTVLYGLVHLIIILFKAFGGNYNIPYESPYPSEPIIITLNFLYNVLLL